MARQIIQNLSPMGTVRQQLNSNFEELYAGQGGGGGGTGAVKININVLATYPNFEIVVEEVVKPQIDALMAAGQNVVLICDDGDVKYEYTAIYYGFSLGVHASWVFISSIPKNVGYVQVPTIIEIGYSIEAKMVTAGVYSGDTDYAISTMYNIDDTEQFINGLQEDIQHTAGNAGFHLGFGAILECSDVAGNRYSFRCCGYSRGTNGSDFTMYFPFTEGTAGPRQLKAVYTEGKATVTIIGT